MLVSNINLIILDNTKETTTAWYQGEGSGIGFPSSILIPMRCGVMQLR